MLWRNSLFPSLSITTILAFLRKIYSCDTDLSKFDESHLHWFSTGARSSVYIYLKSLSNLSDKKEVLVPAFTCCVVYSAIVTAGLKPIVYQSSPVDPVGCYDHIVELVSDDCLCVVTQSVFGYSSHSLASSIKELFPSIFIIDDRAHGASNIFQKPLRPYDAYFYSFEQSKMISAYKGSLLSTYLELDKNALLSPSLLNDSYHLLIFLVSFLLLVQFNGPISLLLYKIFFRLCFVRRSMAQNEIMLESISTKVRKMSIAKKLFLSVQFDNLDLLFRRQIQRLNELGIDTSNIKTIFTRFLVFGSESIEISQSSSIWFKTPLYPTSLSKLKSLGLESLYQSYAKIKFNNLILTRRDLGL